MPDARKDRIAKLIGSALLRAEVIMSEVRDRLIALLTGSYEVETLFSEQTLLREARELLLEFAPTLEQAMVDAEIAAWVTGLKEVEGELPKGALSGPALPVADDLLPEPVIKFPLIEKAAIDILERQVVTRDAFDLMLTEARTRAFTVAGGMTENGIEKIRDALAESLQEGASLEGFRGKVTDAIGHSRLSPSHIENIYRTNIQTAFHTAMDELADNETVQEVFPYCEYLAVHDGRVREEHLALETLGLSGTGIYRTADPFWEVFRPPWDYQCRCTKNLMTIEAAARKGVAEAKEWQRTGVRPPLVSRLPEIPFRPEPEFAR